MVEILLRGMSKRGRFNPAAQDVASICLVSRQHSGDPILGYDGIVVRKQQIFPRCRLDTRVSRRPWTCIGLPDPFQPAAARLEYNSLINNFGMDDNGRRTIQEEIDALSK